MSQIRYVVMSDLHLGADTSLLTELLPGGAGARLSEVGRSLVRGLRSLVEDNGGVKPALVLLGDALEFALAEDQCAAMTFLDFAKQVMKPDEGLFDGIIYVPGNHDHHLWEGARETQYADYVGWRDRDEPLEPPWHDTRMLLQNDPHPVTPPLLTALLRRARGDGGAEVRTVYPNLGLAQGDRWVVLHHGHLMESTYSALTMLDGIIFGSKPPETVGKLEEDNFAWIDFLWSGLGRCGGPGRRVNYIFGKVQDEAGRAGLVDTLTRVLAEKCPDITRVPGLDDWVQQQVIHGALSWVADRAMALGRGAYYGPEAELRKHDAELVAYVDKYVCQQIGQECEGPFPNDVTFVFGHTHTPYARTNVPYRGFPHMPTYNTGGWVHEGAGLEGLIGASLVLISEDLDAAALHLYNEDPQARGVAVQVAGGEETGFSQDLERRLKRDPEAWQELQRTVDAALVEQCERFREMQTT